METRIVMNRNEIEELMKTIDDLPDTEDMGEPEEEASEVLTLVGSAQAPVMAFAASFVVANWPELRTMGSKEVMGLTAAPFVRLAGDTMWADLPVQSQKISSASRMFVKAVCTPTAVDHLMPAPSDSSKSRRLLR